MAKKIVSAAGEAIEGERWEEVLLLLFGANLFSMIKWCFGLS